MPSIPYRHSHITFAKCLCGSNVGLRIKRFLSTPNVAVFHAISPLTSSQLAPAMLHRAVMSYWVAAAHHGFRCRPATASHSMSYCSRFRSPSPSLCVPVPCSAALPPFYPCGLLCCSKPRRSCGLLPAAVASVPRADRDPCCVPCRFLHCWRPSSWFRPWRHPPHPRALRQSLGAAAPSFSSCSCPGHHPHSDYNILFPFHAPLSFIARPSADILCWNYVSHVPTIYM